MSELSFLNNICVVLMRTTHPGNIGAVARACKNMGVSDIRLVNPDDYPSEVATRRASGAEDLLERARIYSSLDDALAGCHTVYGASARTRKMVWPCMQSRECAEFAYERYVESLARHGENKECAGERIALLFGQESSGLTNEELHRCNYHVNIPANPDYASLNLAMAVQLICYEFRMAWLTREADEKLRKKGDTLYAEPCIMDAQSKEWDVPAASVDEVEGMLVHLEKTAIEIGYHDPENPRVLMERFRRLYQRARLDRMEVNILRGMFKAVLQKIGH